MIESAPDAAALLGAAEPAAVLDLARAGEYLAAWRLHQQLCRAHAAEWEAAVAAPGDGFARYLERSRELDRLGVEVWQLQHARSAEAAR